MPPQSAPASVPPSSGTMNASPSGRLARRPQRRGGGGDAADRDLALAADVGEVGAVGQDEAEAHQRQRDGAVDRGADRVRPSRQAPSRTPRRRRAPARRSPHQQRCRRSSAARPATTETAARHGRPRSAASRASDRAMRLSCGAGPTSARRCAPRSLGAGRQLADDPAAVEHDDAIGDRQQLVELARDQQHADAARARPRGSGRRPPRPRRRRGRASAGPPAGHQRIQRQLARQHRLLLVAARQAGERRPRGRRRARRSAASASARGARSARRAASRPKRREAVELVRATCSRPRDMRGDAGHGVAVLRARCRRPPRSRLRRRRAGQRRCRRR